ncbi:Kunitz/Bovine pancreatic trypsin inhibitor domain protein [Ancylostoma ceylanicum]|uniref:Kunitz/Bovine pancreatic trypsin inhibitor domain protein n=2 Tax=Ancylostoma ceylanicum TaxID=53326 RepID=A0A0D6M2N1_9BILA|nr:Kunitz/Bovine pancreatic trypsin inhibitor domain protein [Ancylostoma ceylanicum]EYC16157.1 hypothetical protein Y032_0034g2829 [Ancylostoma ceylanicum]
MSLAFYLFLLLISLVAAKPEKRCFTKIDDHCLVLYQHDVKIGYYYDVKLGKCMSIMVAECKGNEGKFNTLEECQKACEK